MNQQPCDWIFVRDAQRQLCWFGCDDWDQLTMMAALSSDPRSLDELSVAWSRYRPDCPLVELDWRPAPEPPAAGPPTTEPLAPAGGEGLWIDLEHHCYSWSNRQRLELVAGAYERDGESTKGRAESELVYWNMPPWWLELSRRDWPVAKAHAASCRRALDFRRVLYGRSMLESIVASVKAFDWMGARLSIARDLPPGVFASPSDRGESGERGNTRSEANRSDWTAAERKAEKRWRAGLTQIHIDWLMTPRSDLDGEMPREFLHRDRQWKEQELDFRRSQWSRERRPPPGVPRTSPQFLRGPMGTEEVVCYFDYCRDLITAAWRWLDDDPKMSPLALVDELERFKEGWLDSPAGEEEQTPAREVIDGDRALLPRVADHEPLDCDCPVCRAQHLEPALFGPAFWICDGYHLEAENEFAFSLCSTCEEWEESQRLMCGWDEDLDEEEIDDDALAEEDSFDEDVDDADAIGDDGQVAERNIEDSNEDEPQLGRGAQAHRRR
ncbi:MAG: hypothetical protein ACTHOU_16755 [Aureliella sp.]